MAEQLAEERAALAELQTARRQMLPVRLGFASVVVLAFGPLSGWLLCLAWWGAYALLQLAEVLLRGRWRRLGALLGLIHVSSWLFGALGLAGPYLDGPWGLAVSMCLLSGALLFSVLASMRNFAVFMATATPYIVYLCLMPVLALGIGAAPRHALVLGVAGVLIGAASFMIWRVASQAFQAEARARAEAEAADAAKSAFVAMVSHELRTPITAIMAGAVQAGRETSPAARAAHLALIAEAGQMMRVLLGDLLDLSKIEAGRMGVETIAFDLRRLVGDTLRFWRPEARKRGLALRVEGGHGLPAWVSGDPTRLRQVLNNLFSNALKFTQAGEVRLRLDVRPGSGGWTVRFSVADTGSGMRPDQLERLFQPFAQIDDTIARTHGGTGLGLSISRELARLMGGDLSVTATPGAGSTFTLELALPAAEAPAPAAGDAVVPARRGLRILVADDHAVNRRAFALLLEPLAERLVCVEDGLEALAAARAEAFDVILLDLNMPRLGGLEAARWLRAALGAGGEARILALTGSASPADREACAEAGMDGLVEKPVQAAELYAAIDAALEAPRGGAPRLEASG